MEAAMEMRDFGADKGSAAATADMRLAKACSAGGKAERECLLERYQNGTSIRLRPALHVRLQHLTVSGPWLALLISALVVDALACWGEKNPDLTVVQVLALVVCVIFLLDILLRMYAFTLAIFFTKPWNIFDSIAVGVTSVITILILSGPRGMLVQSHKRQGLLWFGQMARIVRLFRITALMRRTCPAMRRITGQNKRRFVCIDYDFDLDLAYITPRLIGMSVPAAGSTTWCYRNPLREVVRFFETFHSGHYMVINACPEIPYSAASFTTGRFEYFDVADHTPPRIDQLVKFLELAAAWISANGENVLAVHCRGGKGRTGSFCCAWLLYVQDAEDARDAVNYFAVRRTDMDHARTKVQGVETPSQVRFVEYIDRLLHQQKSFFPQPVRMPPLVRLCLSELRLYGMFNPPEPAELVAVVQAVARRCTLLVSRASTDRFDLQALAVEGDLRIAVHGRGSLPPTADLERACLLEHTVGAGTGSRRSAAKSERSTCLLCFLLHTSFLEGSQLRLKAPLVDRESKNKAIYNDDGAVELAFSACPL